MALVSGEAGIGKTRLVSEAWGQLQGDDLLVRGNAVDLAGGEVPFGILSSSLRGLVQRHGLDAVRSWAGGDVSRLAVLARELAPESTIVHEPIDVIDAFRGLLARLSRDRLVWWAVEDLHWADASSRDAVRFVVQLMQPPERWLVTCTLRTRDRPPSAEMSVFLSELVRLPATRQIRLEPLDLEQVKVQLSALCGENVSEPLVERVMALSEGVPFLTEELVAGGLRESGPLPTSAAELMLSRLASLDPRAQVVVRAASVAQNYIHDRWLGPVTGMKAGDLEEALRVLVHESVLDLDDSSEGYRFHHELMREAVTVGMLAAERSRWHRCWADALAQLRENERDLSTSLEIARHWTQSGAADRAFTSSVAAARSAELVGAQADRALMLCTAVRLWPQVEEATRSGLDLDDLVEETLWACTLGSRAELGLDMLARRMEMPDEGEEAELRRLRLTLARTRFEGVLGREGRRADRTSTDDQIAVLRRSSRTVLFGRAVAELVAMCWDVETARALEDLLTDALATVTPERSFFDHVDLQDSRTHLLKVLGRYGEAADLSLELLKRARGRLPLSDVVRLESNAVAHLFDVGRFQEAAEVGRRSLDRFSDPRLSPHLWSVLAGNLAATLIETGDWAEADRYLSQAQDLVLLRPISLVCLLDAAVLHGRRGDLAAAARDVDGADQFDPAIATRPAMVAIRELVSAGLALAAGEPVAAWNLLTPLRTARDGQDLALTRDAILLAARALAAAVHEHGQAWDGSAEDHVRDLRREAANLPSLGDLDPAWRDRFEVELARCLGEDTQEQWRAAIAASERFGQPYEQVWALLGLARRALDNRRTDEAAPALEKALAIGERIGAQLLVDAVREIAGRGRIRLTDGEEMSRTRDRAHGLTKRELEVLRLLADGYRNEEIGQALFISPRTASVHVSRILAKLGVDSRSKAAAVAHREGLVKPEGS